MSTAAHAFDDEVPPRSPSELAEQWAYRQDPYFDEPGQREHTRGVRASLLWVMGKQPAAPVSGKVLGRPPSMDDIATEAEYAYESMSGSSERGRGWQQGRSAGYLQGCENALFWAARLGDDDEAGI